MEALKDFYEKNQMVVLGCVVALVVLVLVLFMTKSEYMWNFLGPKPTYAVPVMPWNRSEHIGLSVPGSAQLDPRFYGSTERMSSDEEAALQRKKWLENRSKSEDFNVLDSALKGSERFNVLESALRGGSTEDFNVLDAALQGSEGASDPSETRRTPVLSGQLNPTRMTSSGSAGVLNVHRGDGRRSRRAPSNSSRASVRQGSDNDALATEHMLARGGAERAIMDASRNRYQGMAKIGADDYEGYVYEGSGHVYSDEQGELTATVYGVNESPW